MLQKDPTLGWMNCVTFFGIFFLYVRVCVCVCVCVYDCVKNAESQRQWTF